MTELFSEETTTRMGELAQVSPQDALKEKVAELSALIRLVAASREALLEVSSEIGQLGIEGEKILKQIEGAIGELQYEPLVTRLGHARRRLPPPPFQIVKKVMLDKVAKRAMASINK